MTLVRKLTLKISALVVRYASSGCKEWAEGLSREAAFIENDWAALRWALGSMKILFDRREAPIASLAEIPDIARKFADKRHTAAVSGTCMLLFVFVHGFNLAFAKGWLEQIGSTLVELGALSIGICSFIERRRLNAFFRCDIEDDVLFYKQELERMCNFPGALESWIMFIGALFLVTGSILNLRGGFLATTGFKLSLAIPLILGGVLMNLRIRRINRRRLERLEELLAERSQNIQ